MLRRSTNGSTPETALPQLRKIRFPLHAVGALLDASAVHPGRTARNHLAWLAASNEIPCSRVDEVLGTWTSPAAASSRRGV